MNGNKLVCGVCGTVFSEHEARLNPIDPEEDQLQCPKCGSTRVEPYTFDPDAPVSNPLEEEDEL